MIKSIIRIILIPRRFFFNLGIKINTWLFYTTVRYQCPAAYLGENIVAYGKVFVSINRTANIKIYDNVIFRSHTKYNQIGIYKPVSICVDPDCELIIGRHSAFSGTSIYVANSIKIGEYSNFGSNTSIWDSDFHPLNHQLRQKSIDGATKKPIQIGADVFIGANAIILKGVTIGNKAVLGAGSVVSKNIPEGQVWAGNPARFIKNI